jgi:hypothetical protein
VGNLPISTDFEVWDFHLSKRFFVPRLSLLFPVKAIRVKNQMRWY